MTSSNLSSVRHGKVNSIALLAVLAAITATTCPSMALAADPEEEDVNVTLVVEPFADLQFLDTPLLVLNVPPPGSTIPSNGVRFKVTGNADATITAIPTGGTDPFIFIPPAVDPDNTGYMGRATLGTSSIGYKIELRFPSSGSGPSPIQIATLPGTSEGSTVPPLTVDLLTTGGSRNGVIHMESSQEWTEDGSLPLAGLHVGQVTITLTASD